MDLECCKVQKRLRENVGLDRSDSMKERIWKKDQEQDHGVRAKNTAL